MTKEKIVLAYSGGLDTSIILKWLQTQNYEVIVFTADIGQCEDNKTIYSKAIAMGIKPENIFIENLKEEFVSEYVFPMFMANAIYEGEYLLGTSIARPVISKKQIEIAQKTGASFVAHGATGKGNDQIRFELSYYALDPKIKVIAPWREWDIHTRNDLINYAKLHNIEVPTDKIGEAPYSMDANLLHISYEGKILENPAIAYDPSILRRCKTIEEAPNQKTKLSIEFENGIPISINNEKLSAADILTKLNELGGNNAIGVIDIVENRFIGMKSRGIYETPGGTILLKAHRAIESITLDRELAHLKDELMPRYAKLIYNGFWFSREREALQAFITESQINVTGRVNISLLKGNVIIEGRESNYSLYKDRLASFDDPNCNYNHKDADGFIKLNSLRLKTINYYKNQ